MYVVQDYIREPLYVITPVFNPIRYKTRWKLYQRFAKMVHDAGAILVTVEAAFGERNPALKTDAQAAPVDFQPKQSQAGDRMHQYLKVQTSQELWLKENLINYAMARLPHDWKYVAWVDADVAFARPNWVGETIHQLQHYPIIQMFSQAVDLDPEYQIIKTHKGFVASLLESDGAAPPDDYYYADPNHNKLSWHPGFAWAARRDAIDNLGGLIDWGIVGSGDNMMAHALLGNAANILRTGVHPAYRRMTMAWQTQAETHIRRNIGMLSGLLLHYWHGKKRDRRYRDRWKILIENRFNPDLDLKRDWQGLWQLVDHGDDRSRRLRDQLKGYFRARNEDSIDTE